MGDRTKPAVLTILGSTAIGKTRIAIEIAESSGGEIVSCDSRQVFKHLDIGTAKPTAEERDRAVFHLIDFLEPTRFMNAHEFRELADDAIADVLKRGKTPILTVGTGLYLKAMTDGIFEAPPADDEFRDEMKTLADREGAEHLWDRLNKVDPIAAADIGKRDIVRTVRALELYHLTGLTKKELMDRNQLPPLQYEFRMYELTFDRDSLYARIDTRCEQMIEDGLIEEAENLRSGKILSDDMAYKIVGYNEVYRYLDGEFNKEEMIDKFQQATRNYAKRQLTWFRNNTDAMEVDASNVLASETIIGAFTE